MKGRKRKEKGIRKGEKRKMGEDGRSIVVS